MNWIPYAQLFVALLSMFFFGMQVERLAQSRRTAKCGWQVGLSDWHCTIPGHRCGEIP